MAAPEETIDALVVSDFGGEDRAFRLTVPWLEKVERDCDAGAAVIAGEIARGVQVLEVYAEKKITAVAAIAAGLGAWRSSYIRQVIYWGLQGGGMAPGEAGKLVRRYIDERGFMGLIENVDLAFKVITGANSGPGDDPVGESGGAAATAPKKTPRRRSQTGAPASA